MTFEARNIRYSGVYRAVRTLGVQAYDRGLNLENMERRLDHLCSMLSAPYSKTVQVLASGDASQQGHLRKKRVDLLSCLGSVFLRLNTA